MNRWLFLILLLCVTLSVVGGKGISRDDFPREFVFGSGTSAYQVEGAAAEDGRKPSIWDTFQTPVYGGSTGVVASDGYHKYKEDVKLLAEMGLEGYRFSISWTRLIPNGRGDINPKGLKFYNNLINELVSHGIQPHVTLSHFDYPQLLQDEYGGWLSPRIVQVWDDFTAFADVCFREFGDRVSHWVTINEANIVAIGGFGSGFVPPGRCSYPYGNCTSGYSIFEPYIVAHNVLLAHSSVVSFYRRKYQEIQQGSVGLNLLIFHFKPKTDSRADINATMRAQDFFIGWFVDPLVYGDYPTTVRKAAGLKLPNFSQNQSKQLIGAFDFLDLVPKDVPSNPDRMINTTSGLIGVLEYMKQRYNNPTLYIHENGFATPHNGSLNDTPRVKQLISTLEVLRDALSTEEDQH